jgi:aspartate kinase
MNIFKFGGASVKNAEAVKNVRNIIHKFHGNSIIVISAMGKTTNAFENLLNSFFTNDGKTTENFNSIHTYHYEIVEQLFTENEHPIYMEIQSVFNSITEILQTPPSTNYDFEYDRLVSFGEILSSIILSGYLNYSGYENQWLDARSIIKTDNTYRDATVLWSETTEIITQSISNNTNYVIQGFLGGTTANIPTTLGREGSDFTAAIIAYCLNADKVTIWKNVPGILNADPALFTDTKKIDVLSYHDAIELSYYGAKIIHPKTIKPIENKKIPLYVKSFIHPENDGTEISNKKSIIPCPVYITKQNQVLITVSPKDFSFIAEKNLGEIFTLLSQMRIKVNVMQNSAISFSMVTDYNSKKIDTLINQLNKSYKCKYNYEVELITIWHYDDETISKLTKGKEILLEERSRFTNQIVIR